MKHSDRKFYVVDAEILPEGILKAAQLKEMLNRGEAASVPEAAEKLGIAKSTFYKYRDGVFTFFDLRTMEITNLSLVLDHTPGVLSRVIAQIAESSGNVLTINQGLPSHGTALVTISVGMEHATTDPAGLIDAFLALPGVLDAKIDGVS
ncbi:MAG: ACT domain-containing protein [Oscillospiraceae bacterium]|nr:ACT domain-containing protein [Oscillospiraceae bacterium]